jgi:hypothetical protein
MNLSFTLVPMTDTDQFNCTFNPKENLSVKVGHRTWMDVPVDWERVNDAGDIDRGPDGYGALLGKVRLPFDFGFNGSFEPPLVYAHFPTKDSDYAKYYKHPHGFNKVMCYQCVKEGDDCNEAVATDESERLWKECKSSFYQVYIRPDTLLKLVTCRDVEGTEHKAQNSWFVVPNLISDKQKLEDYLHEKQIAFGAPLPGKKVCEQTKSNVTCTPISWFFANAYPHGIFVSANRTLVRTTQVLRFAQLQTNTTIPSFLPWKTTITTSTKTMITNAPLHAGSDVFEEEQAGVVLTADPILQQRLLFPGMTLSSVFTEWMNTVNTVAGYLIGWFFMTSLGVPIYSSWSSWGKAYKATAHENAGRFLDVP